MKRFRKPAVAAVVAAGAILAATAVGSPSQVTISLKGIHSADDFHQGTFTAPAPLCSAGTWIGNGAGARVFTCSDGSGTFTATFNGDLEHVAGASGPWQITLGTGKYTTLRGRGTGTIDASTGPNASPVVFADTWTGVADFDTVAPTGSITAVRIERPHTPSRRWTVRMTLAARDNVAGNPVDFFATVTAGRFFSQKKGTVTAGAASFSVTFRPAATTKRLQVAVDLEDPVGNRSTVQKSVSLR